MVWRTVPTEVRLGVPAEGVLPARVGSLDSMVHVGSLDFMMQVEPSSRFSSVAGNAGTRSTKIYYYRSANIIKLDRIFPYMVPISRSLVSQPGANLVRFCSLRNGRRSDLSENCLCGMLSQAADVIRDSGFC